MYPSGTRFILRNIEFRLTGFDPSFNSQATSDLFNKYVKDQLMDIVDKDRRVKHSKLADGIEEALQNKKYVSGLDASQLEMCYPSIIQVCAFIEMCYPSFIQVCQIVNDSMWECVIFPSSRISIIQHTLIRVITFGLRWFKDSKLLLFK